MVSTKKKRRTPKARIPSEIIAIESILKSGRIRFRCFWQIYDFGEGKKRTPGWQTIRSKIWKFSAGSMEELLAAIHKAVLEVSGMPGVKLEAGWRKFCPKCGRTMTISTEHECPDIGEQIAKMNAARLGRIKTLDKGERVNGTINAEGSIQWEKKVDR